jgi:tetratricopeptide (TPR) repeat protein
VEINPGEKRAFEQRGNVKLSKGDLDGAIGDFSKCIEIDPRFLFGWRQRANAKARRREYERAIADLDRALDLEPQFPPLFLDRGLLHYRLTNNIAARLDLDEAIRLNPRFVQAYNIRARLRVRLKDYEGARLDYAAALKADPFDSTSYQNRGYLNYDVQQWGDALKDFKRALELESTVPVYQEYARLRIWLLSARTGRAEFATEELRDYLKTRRIGKPGDWFTSVANFLMGEIDAKALLKEVEVTDPQSRKERFTEAQFNIGVKRLIAGDVTAAVESLKLCIRTHLINA